MLNIECVKWSLSDWDLYTSAGHVFLPFSIMAGGLEFYKADFYYELSYLKSTSLQLSFAEKCCPFGVKIAQARSLCLHNPSAWKGFSVYLFIYSTCPLRLVLLSYKTKSRQQLDWQSIMLFPEVLSQPGWLLTWYNMFLLSPNGVVSDVEIAVIWEAKVW